MIRVTMISLFVVLLPTLGYSQTPCPIVLHEDREDLVYFDGKSDKLRKFAVERARWAADKWMPDIYEQGLRLHERKIPIEVIIEDHPTEENTPFCARMNLKPHVDGGRIIIPASYTELMMIRMEDWAIAEKLAQRALPGLMLGTEEGIDLMRCGMQTIQFDHFDPPPFLEICGSAKSEWFEIYGSIRGDAAKMNAVAEQFDHLLYMALAHEYAHILLDHPLPNETDEAQRREHEIEADVFAFRAYSEDALDGSGIGQLMALFTLDQDIFEKRFIDEVSTGPVFAGLSSRDERALGAYLQGRCRAGEVLKRVGVADPLNTFEPDSLGSASALIGLRLITSFLETQNIDFVDAAIYCGSSLLD